MLPSVSIISTLFPPRHPKPVVPAANMVRLPTAPSAAELLGRLPVLLLGLLLLTGSRCGVLAIA